MKKLLLIALLVVGCEEPAKHGCLDSQACNYAAGATIDNNSCIYVSDCAGVCGGDNVKDNCDTCDSDATNDCIKDECGVWGGDGVVQTCGCGTDGELGIPDGKCDCNGNVLDACGICDGNNSPNTGTCDCAGTPNGDATTDNCGACVGGTTGATACVQDDCGVWGGTGGVWLWGECYNIVGTTSLALGGNQLTGEIPSEIGNLTNLTGLSLYFNQLTGEIPPEVCDLIESNNLSLSSITDGNNFTNTCE